RSELTGAARRVWARRVAARRPVERVVRTSVAREPARSRWRVIDAIDPRASRNSTEPGTILRKRCYASQSHEPQLCVGLRTQRFVAVFLSVEHSAIADASCARIPTIDLACPGSTEF